MNTVETMIVILRVVIGLLFFAHGAQKLFGWFGGHGWRGTQGFVTQLGLRPAAFWALMLRLSGLFGGLMLVLGFLTPLGAASIVAGQIVAIAKVHGPKGLWTTSGGYE